MKVKFSLLVFLMFSIFLKAQSGTPTDFLSKEFHKERRELFRAKMPKNSVAAFFANPVRNRANDVDYVYHQDPNFYYLTGYREPNAVLLIYSDMQTDEKGNTYNEILYVQEKDKRREQWDGVRLGIEGAKTKLGFKTAMNGEDFLNAEIDLKAFDKVFIDGKFKDDYRDTRERIDMLDLVKSFKKKAEYNPELLLPPVVNTFYNYIRETPVEQRSRIVAIIKQYQYRIPALRKDPNIQKYLKASSDELAKDAQKSVILALQAGSNIDISFIPDQMATLREVKTEEELNLLIKAVRISAIGQIEVMKAMKPNMSETEVQGIHEFVYKKYGAEYEGYPSIVGAGNNGCILHYIENNKTKLGNELVLMDLGAEYRGYTADVTRTIPANGKFTPEQKAIYDLVYEAQEAGIAKYVIGESMQAPVQIARKIINEGLAKLGIIDSPDAKHDYFPHGTSHHIGLDVHDPGNYQKFQKNMVVTMEPGIYIPEGSPCDKKWWGIGVRIEDDILVTDGKPINLSGEAPRTTEAIEKMMAKRSILEEFVLPDLDKK
ncbi:MAG: Xaa-Pro aminopeptidase [Flavobacteriaceae bacterium]|nr:Xaa-Pro aminopeptidase [Flavobacteriaceae bacterium]|tara:strand:+ start:108312 stop:109946 length:1635 start_codon:yes stop_codon:yes gene_type:complete